MTTIDIVVPFYGDVGYLRDAVQSVLRQTDPHWRLTVVDDRYPHEDVGAWLRGLDHPQVRYLRNDVNLGVNRNFARALSTADEDWVTFLGCDDLLLPDYVHTVRSLISSHPSCAVVQPGVRVIDRAGRPARPLPDRLKDVLRPRRLGAVLAGEQLASSLLRGNWTYFPSLCWRREAVARTGFRAGLDVVLDLDLLLDVVAHGGTLVLDPRPVFLYRRHASSESMKAASAGSRFREERDFFRAQSTACHARGWHKAERAARWHLMSRLNAASLLPSALRRRDGAALAALLGHLLPTRVSAAQEMH